MLPEFEIPNSYYFEILNIYYYCEERERKTIYDIPFSLPSLRGLRIWNDGIIDKVGTFTKKTFSMHQPGMVHAG